VQPGPRGQVPGGQRPGAGQRPVQAQPVTEVPAVRRSRWGGAAISLAVLAGVYAMRWNVVLGGQAQSKISAGTLSISVP
jgi:hypothetical protein